MKVASLSVFYRQESKCISAQQSYTEILSTKSSEFPPAISESFCTDVQRGLVVYWWNMLIPFGSSRIRVKYGTLTVKYVSRPRHIHVLYFKRTYFPPQIFPLVLINNQFHLACSHLFLIFICNMHNNYEVFLTCV